MTKNLFIGLPVYGNVDPHFFKCALRLVAEFSTNTAIMPWVGDSLIPRARNALSAQFLKSDCSHMLMIDSDLLFSPDHISRILSRDVDVVGGFYPRKAEGPVCLVSNGFVPAEAPREDGLVRVRAMGSGFILIARQVFERMIEAYRDEIEYVPDEQKHVEWDFWRTGVYKYHDGSKRYLSEDWYFCQRCIDLGFDVWGDTHIGLKHSGNALFPLSYQEKEFFKAPAAVTA